MDHTCEYQNCQKRFTPRRVDARFCSSTCRSRANKAKQMPIRGKTHEIVPTKPGSSTLELTLPRIAHPDSHPVGSSGIERGPHEIDPRNSLPNPLQKEPRTALLRAEENPTTRVHKNDENVCTPQNDTGWPKAMADVVSQLSKVESRLTALEELNHSGLSVQQVKDIIKLETKAHTRNIVLLSNTVAFRDEVDVLSGKLVYLKKDVEKVASDMAAVNKRAESPNKEAANEQVEIRNLSLRLARTERDMGRLGTALAEANSRIEALFREDAETEKALHAHAKRINEYGRMLQALQEDDD